MVARSAFADLLRATRALGLAPEQERAAARLLGLNLRDGTDVASPTQVSETPAPETHASQDKVMASELSADPDPWPTTNTRVESLAPEPGTPPVWLNDIGEFQRQKEGDWMRRRPQAAPPLLPKVWARRVLAQILSHTSCRGPLDIARFIRLLARRQPVKQLPRLSRPRLANAVQILMDNGDGMAPFQDDQRHLLSVVRLLFPSSALRVLYFVGSPRRGVRAEREVLESPYSLPPRGSAVLLLSDLGLSDSAGPWDRDWIDWAAQLVSHRCKLATLIPYPLERLPKVLRGTLGIIPWEAPQPPPFRPWMANLLDPLTPEQRLWAETHPEALQLALHLSLAARIEPALLRAVRHQFVPTAPAAAEADLWHSPLIDDRSRLYVSIEPSVAEGLRGLLRQDPERLVELRHLIKGLHKYLPPLARLEETLLYLATAQPPGFQGLIEAKVRPLLKSLTGNSARCEPLASWCSANLPRLPGSAYTPAVWNARAIAHLILHLNEPISIDPALDNGPRASEDSAYFWKQLRRIAVGISYSDGRLRVCDSNDQDSGATVPNTSPRILDLIYDGGPLQRVIWRPGESAQISVSRPLYLRALDGGRFRLADSIATPPLVYIVYSHADEAWKDRLVSQLSVLEHAGQLRVGDDRRIAAGADWLPEIQEALDGCSVALLLISANFLISRFILDIEVPQLLRRQAQDSLRIIPVFLKPCAWQQIDWLGRIQGWPTNGKPLSTMRKRNLDASLADLAKMIAGLLDRAPAISQVRIGGTAPAAPRIDLTRLPASANEFLGRGSELAMLDAAWSGKGDGGGVQVVELVAPGGVGKTALVKRWLDRLRAVGWRGAEQIFGWSFYSQGTGDDRQASDDLFLSEALAWFGVAHDPAASPWDKGRLLAQAVAARRTLLVLDGCEPLQYPPGPLAGHLRAPGLKVLLAQLAGAGQPGLTLLTSREAIADLAEYARGPQYPQGAVLTHDLGNLSDTDGALLLHRLGCVRAGAAAIGPDDPELIAASRQVQGHAFTLHLLGGFLAVAYGGDIRQRDKVSLKDADASQGGYASRLMVAYERWFERAGERGSREWAALSLLGFFDRPADEGCLAALCQAPPISGLTEPLAGLGSAQWNLLWSRLAACALIEQPPADESATARPAIDAHPLVREYLGTRLRETRPDAWREGHRRIYEYLKSSVPHRPDGLAELQPLYQAVEHGCRAGLQQQTCVEVYFERILRGTGPDGFYSTKNLGAVGADLGAVACFFDEPWRRVSAALGASEQAWLLNQAAFLLGALGRPSEALEPVRASLEMGVRQEDWKSAAISAGNLSELGLTLGLVSEATADGERSVEYADRCGDAYWTMLNCTALADALYQHGQREKASQLFREADSIQAKFLPQHLLLCGLPGFRYCDLLLDEPERVAWQVFLASFQDVGRVGPDTSTEAVDQAANEGSAAAVPSAVQSDLESALRHTAVPVRVVPPTLLAECEAVVERIRKAKAIDEQSGDLLAIAFNHLILGRAALFLGLLDSAGPSQSVLERAARSLAAAVDGLRAAGTQNHLPRGLLARALLHALLQSPAAARADLDEAWQIASRGGMRLHMADCQLHRARLFRDHTSLAQARALIEQCGYWRRKEELEDAEQVARYWLSAPLSPSSAEPRPAPVRASATGATQSAQAMPPIPIAPVDFVILTPSPEECEAVLTRLPGYHKVASAQDDRRVWYASEIPIRSSDGPPARYSAIVAPPAGMGHAEAARTVDDAILRWQPRYILLVGLAGGIASAGVNLGDVLVSDQVAVYEFAPLTPENVATDMRVHPVDRTLIIAAAKFDGGDFTRTTVPRPHKGPDQAPSRDRPIVHIGTICTGDKVLANENLTKQLRETSTKLIGIEMESGGVAYAASRSVRHPGFFMILGVTDLADSEKDAAEIKRWRSYASEIAAAWALEFLKSGLIPAAD